MRSFDATLKPVISFGIPLATANPSGTLQTYLVAAIRPSGGGSGTVTSVNAVLPDIAGNVELTPGDIGAQPAGDYLLNTATGAYSVSTGAGSNASGDLSVAVGGFAIAAGANSVAVGDGADATGNASVSIGAQSEAAAYSAAVGFAALATGPYSTAQGHAANAAGAYSTALGRAAEVLGEGSTSIGSETNASNLNAVALGRFSQTGRDDEVQVGGASSRFVAGVRAAELPGDAVNLSQLESAAGVLSLSREFASTGDLQGGQLSINAGNAALLDVAAITALFMDYSDYDNPVGVEITVGPFIGVTLTNLATATATYIGLDDAGALVQQTSPFTNTQRRNIVSLGAAIHSNHTTITTINTLVATGRALANQLYDFMLGVFGRLNQSGNLYGPNGANLQINKSAGRLFQPGIAFHITPDDPHFLDIAAQTAPTFAYRLRGGTQYANTTAIDPDNYDAAGVLTAVPNNKFTVQRITLFQSGLTRIQYGQNVYNSLADAQGSAVSEAFVTEQNIGENGVLRAYLIVKKGTTDLTDPARVSFLEAGKFGGTVANVAVGLTAQNVIDALTYTPENVANKTTEITIASTDDQYPTAKTIYDERYLSNNATGGPFALAVGDENVIATGAYAIAVGNGTALFPTIASAEVSVAIGSSVSATGDLSVALGVGGTTASGPYSTALGAYAMATHSHSVALGAGSDTGRANEVSVGGGGVLKRFVANVANAALAADAVPLGQTFTTAVNGLVPAPGAGAVRVLQSDGTWGTVAASPGGSTTQLQYNNAGAFGGIPGATFSGNTLAIVSQAAGAIPFAIQAATSQTGNLTEWRNSVGAIGARMSSAFGLTIGAGITSSGTFDLVPSNVNFTVRVGTNGFYPLTNNAVDLGFAGGNFSWKSLQLCGRVGWDNGSGTIDTILDRLSAAIVAVRGASSSVGAALSFIEQTAPAAPATNGVYLYSQDNGAGKTQLMARFATGAAQQVAIEP